jgi:hypothetical protein
MRSLQKHRTDYRLFCVGYLSVYTEQQRPAVLRSNRVCSVNCNNSDPREYVIT